MFVPCPHCQFLVAHHPQLRPLPPDCPRCGRSLQEDGAPATGTAVDAGDPDEATALASDTGANARPDADAAPVDAAPVDAEPATGISDAGGAAGGMSTPSDTAAALDAAIDAPPARFAMPATANLGSRWRWPLIAMLVVLLVLQVLLADRARLAADARWRPMLEQLCGALHCSLPPWDEPAAFTMLDRKVQPSPQPGALRVDATFRNDARWPQAWPALQLALADADGHVLGSRVFQPVDYLGQSPTTLLSPGQSAQITFLVQEPAPGTVAFSFEFR